MCEHGTEQSPIDIPGAEVPPAELAVTCRYRPCPLEILNDGYTVQVNCASGSTLRLGGETYDLQQFHFHARSEHTVDGEAFPAELHLVHAGPGGELVVIGVFLEVGAESDALAAVFEHLPSTPGAPLRIAGQRVDLPVLLPADMCGWSYTGSLTTPPWTEGVRWLLLSTPIEISAAQLAAYTAVCEHNHRPIQALGDREVVGGV